MSRVTKNFFGVADTVGMRYALGMAKLPPPTEGPLTKEQTELTESLRQAFDELREFEDQLGWED